ncbi:MAG: response regulator transcription factor, partial [Rhodospirillales bacterium]|nr:response regulator transcription factor [Rhodospirillales bacterium]
MYALIATHNTALRSAISVLLRICHPGCNIVMANDVGDVHALLEAGQCDTMLVDTQFSGYGSAFDVDMLRRYYPHVNFLPLASAGDIPPGMDVPPGLDVLDSELDDPMPHAALAHGLAGSPPARAAATSVDHLLRAIQVIGSAEVVAGPPRVRFAEPAAESSPALTARQRVVLILLGEGRSTKDIAR